MLDSGFGVGLLLVEGTHRPGIHQPVITPETWQAYQVARQQRRTARSAERSQYLLSGLVRCACGSTMTAGQFGHARTPKLRCKAAHEQGRHTGGYITTSTVEAEVLAWLKTEAAADLDAAAERAAAQANTRRRARTDADLLTRRILELDHQLEEATRQMIRGIIPEPTYLTIRDELTTDRERLTHAQRAATVDAGASDLMPLVHDLLARWDTEPVEIRRAMLKRLIRVITITPGRPRGTVQITPAWETKAN